MWYVDNRAWSSASALHQEQELALFSLYLVFTGIDLAGDLCLTVSRRGLVFFHREG